MHHVIISNKSLSRDLASLVFYVPLSYCTALLLRGLSGLTHTPISGCISQLCLTVLVSAGFVDPKTNNFPGSMAAYCSDGASIVIGSLMGTSPVTVFVGKLQLLGLCHQSITCL